MFILKKKVEHLTFVKDNEYGNTLAEEVYWICRERFTSNLISNIAFIDLFISFKLKELLK
jgi:hypothetical protein